MKTTRIVVLNVNGETKRLQAVFNFTKNKNHKEFGRLWYCLRELRQRRQEPVRVKDGWWCWHTTGYDNQEEAILAFCKKYWGEKLVSIE